MIRISLYLLLSLAVFTIIKGFCMGKMDGNTTLYEVASAMKDYRVQIIEKINNIAEK